MVNYPLERAFWLIKLRWLAAAGVIGTVYIVNIAIPLAVLPLYSIAVILAVYNSLFFFLAFYLKNRAYPDSGLINILANAQIALDLLCLAVLIHFSGGVENPFIFYFIFHMIIASILLRRRAAFLQATYATALFLLMVSLEYFDLLPHYCLKGVFPFSLHHNPAYILGISFVFTSTLYIAVYMATSISGQLREKEKSLKKANELLKEKDRIKSEYVLNVTHDIKEDLSAIHSCIEPVTEGITGHLNEGQKDLLTRAKKRSKKLIVYINALLNITRIKLTKKLKMEQFSFPELAKEICENIAPRAKSKNIDFKLEVEPFIKEVTGVRVYIHETILNLLANAVKYTPSGGRISLEVKEKGDSLLIEIKDTGIGIPKEALPYVFDEFYRAENACKIEKQGTGLGLSIAKQLVQRHRGRIWVESEINKGTNFYIELPMKI